MISGLPVLACEAPKGAAVAAVKIAADGDLTLADGRVVRLSGLLWPGPEDKAARASLKAALELWIVDAPVLVQPLGKADRWNRLPAQVFSAATGEAPVWLQGMLVENGYVAAWPDTDAKGCWADLAVRESQAVRLGLGRWSPVVRRAHRLRLKGGAEHRLSTRFVYEARVRSVRTGRQITFVNFPGRRETTPYLSLSKRLVEEFRKQGLDPATFSGKRLRVRAQVVRAAAVRLDVAGPQSIEVLE